MHLHFFYSDLSTLLDARLLGNAFVICIQNPSSFAVTSGNTVRRAILLRRLLADERTGSAALIVNHVRAAAMALAVSKRG